VVTLKNGTLVCLSCGSSDCEHVGLFREVYGDMETLKNLSRFRRRERPGREEEGIRVSSEMTRDIYTVFKMSDGSYACNCPAFLTGKVALIDEGRKGVACKHIKDMQERVDDDHRFANSTQYQGLLFKALTGDDGNLRNFRHYTDGQAYIVIDELLKRQNLKFHEVENSLENGRAISILPAVSFGIEYEAGGLRRHRIAEILLNEGYFGYLTNVYRSVKANTSVDITRAAPGISQAGHGLIVVPHRKAEESCFINSGTDTSISLPNGVEIKSPRLMGITGANSLRSFTGILETLRANRLTTNSSCGMHLSLSAYGLTKEDVGRYFLLWACWQDHIQYLVSPSRRGNHYCKKIPPNQITALYSRIMQSFASGLPWNRYLALNLKPLKLVNGKFQGRMEIRLHDASNQKIHSKFSAWVTFCLKMLDASQRNPEVLALLDRAIENPRSRGSLRNIPFEDVLTMIGIDTSTSFMKAQREHLLYRYEAYRRKAENRDLRGLHMWVRERMICPDSSSIVLLDEIAQDAGVAFEGQAPQVQPEPGIAEPSPSPAEIRPVRGLDLAHRAINHLNSDGKYMVREDDSRYQAIWDNLAGNMGDETVATCYNHDGRLVFLTQSGDDDGGLYIQTLISINENDNGHGDQGVTMGVCSCPGYRYRRDCRHLRNAAERILGVDRVLSIPADENPIRWINSINNTITHAESDDRRPVEQAESRDVLGTLADALFDLSRKAVEAARQGDLGLLRFAYLNNQDNESLRVSCGSSLTDALDAFVQTVHRANLNVLTVHGNVRDVVLAPALSTNVLSVFYSHSINMTVIHDSEADRFVVLRHGRSGRDFVQTFKKVPGADEDHFIVLRKCSCGTFASRHNCRHVQEAAEILRGQGFEMFNRPHTAFFTATGGVANQEEELTVSTAPMRRRSRLAMSA